MTNQTNDTHSKFIGYLVWIFGFFGAHRFYYGKNKTGVLWFFTLGLFFIGWLVDLFLIPSMDREADKRYTAGPTDYTLTWILHTFLWPFGAHRFYMGKIASAMVYLICTGIAALGFLPVMIIPAIGALYDFLTLNSQVDELNRLARA